MGVIPQTGYKGKDCFPVFLAILLGSVMANGRVLFGFGTQISAPAESLNRSRFTVGMNSSGSYIRVFSLRIHLRSAMSVQTAVSLEGGGEVSGKVAYIHRQRGGVIPLQALD
jgi:hypothetical protein